MAGQANPEQKDALAAIGESLVFVQMAERVIKLCMTWVLQPSGGLTLEKLESLQSDEAHRTLGYFLGQLRQRASIDPTFDEHLKEFLKLRNQLAHNLSEIPGLGFSRPEEIAVAVQWADKLSSLALHVQNVFIGLVRAWQHEIGMRDDFADNDFFREIDMKFKPHVSKIFMAKPSVTKPGVT